MASPTSAGSSIEPPKTSTAQTSAAPASTATNTGPKPPPGFKFVKVKKADGSIVTVKRKLSPEELAAAGVADTQNTAATPTPPAPQADFKIVTVRKADGSLVKVKRAINPEAESSTAPSTTPSVIPSVASPASPTAASTAAPAVANAEKTIVKDESSKATVEVLSKAKEQIVPDNVPTAPPPSSQGSKTLEQALAEQAAYHRQRKRGRFASSVTRGFSKIAIAALPGVHVDDNFQDGDEIISDDDYSDDDLSDDDHDRASAHTSDEREKQHQDEHTGSRSPVTFDANTALSGAAGMAANAATQQTPSHPPPAYNTTGARDEKKDAEKQKVSYKITAKTLDDIEGQAAEKQSQRSLQRHWANFSFYFMGSLSIVLPILFLILSAFIIAMKGKLVTSSWSKMEDAIKVAISAWPIVFAAVVAQCFKSWATFKVERGIKLMELEQLVGSSSFASAMKQPFLLRRLDLLSLVLFCVWCLSPIGSQGLQRAYGTERKIITDYVPAFYLDYTGENQIWGPDWRESMNQDNRSQSIQLIATDYIGSLKADGISEDTYFTDEYSHPIITTAGNSNRVASYGVPVTVPQSILNQDLADSDEGRMNPPWELISFNMTTSYFNLTCGDWSVRNYSQIEELDYPTFSWSYTLGLGVPLLDFTTTSFWFASLNKASSVEGKIKVNSSQPVPEANWEYSFIECDFRQVYVEIPIECTRSTEDYASTCTASADSREVTGNFTGTPLGFDFLEYLANEGSIMSDGFPTTATEEYAFFESKVTGLWEDQVNLGEDTTAADFSQYFGFLFNTWVGLGYCPACLNLANNDDFDATPTTTKLKTFFREVNATRDYSQEMIYTISVPWIIVFVVCTAILLVAGTISVIVESMTVAPDVLGYVSTVARNSRYLHLPKTNSAMSGGERLKTMGGVKVMMQDVKANADVGKIALGMKHESAERLRSGRLYR